MTSTDAVNHLVVQTDDLDATITDLATRGVPAEPPAEPGPGLRTLRPAPPTDVILQIAPHHRL